MSARRILGIVGILVGAALVVFFRDARLGWFEGGWLGLGLIVLGLWDLGSAFAASRGHRSATLMDDLRKDFGQRRGDQGDDGER